MRQLSGITLVATERENPTAWSPRDGIWLPRLTPGEARPERQSTLLAEVRAAAEQDLPDCGLLWRGAGVEQEAIGAMAAHAFATGLLGAALRLGLIGHVDGQRILAGLRPLVAGILATPPPPVEDICSFTPEAEIAVLRHETADARLFAT